MKKIIIFGAGNMGKRAFIKYGIDNVLFFIDNNEHIHGKNLNGLDIKAPSVLSEITTECKVIIASRHSGSMAAQLEGMGITDFEIYSENSYFDIPEVVFNPYSSQLDKNEVDQRDELKIKDINQKVTELTGSKIPLFNHIEIETVNRCNGVCGFCPVNKNADTRPYKKMEEELFYSIIHQLENLNYRGKIALFSNNEPFLDERIIKFQKYMREHLPYARTHLCTNGTLLTIDKFLEIIPYLDELIIDNYNDELSLIAPCRKIAEYCEEHTELKKKVTIVLRKINEVLTSRGGDSPNAEHCEKYPQASCLLPYKQMIVRPDGKVSLCCNDALGKCTMGDLNKESIEQVWFGRRFEKVRELLVNGRKEVERCQYCDTLFIC